MTTEGAINLLPYGKSCRTSEFMHQAENSSRKRNYARPQQMGFCLRPKKDRTLSSHKSTMAINTRSDDSDGDNVSNTSTSLQLVWYGMLPSLGDASSIGP